jgi:hypothetical protein
MGQYTGRQKRRNDSSADTANVTPRKDPYKAAAGL